MENKVKIISYQAILNTGSVFVTIELTIGGNAVRIDNIAIFETHLYELCKADDRSVWDETDILSAVSEFFEQISENIVF